MTNESGNNNKVTKAVFYFSNKVANNEDISFTMNYSVVVQPKVSECKFCMRRRKLGCAKKTYDSPLNKCLTNVLLCLLILIQSCSGVKESHFVHWNTSNPIFRIDNTDHVIDVNRGNKPWEHDQVNIICPVYRRGTVHPDDMEEYIIYSVSKEEYDTCRITSGNPRVIAICNKPYELMYFTITFRSFTPTPGGMEFKPGHDYYFVSTSSKNDLYRRFGGHCASHHMKVSFKVADNSQSSPSQERTPRPNFSQRRRPILPDSMKDQVPLYRQQDRYRDTYYMDKYHMDKYPDIYEENLKKKEEYEVHTNEVIKQQPSISMAEAAAATGQSGSTSSQQQQPIHPIVLFAFGMLIRSTTF